MLSAKEMHLPAEQHFALTVKMYDAAAARKSRNGCLKSMSSLLSTEDLEVAVVMEVGELLSVVNLLSEFALPLSAALLLTLSYTTLPIPQSAS